MRKCKWYVMLLLLLSLLLVLSPVACSQPQRTTQEPPQDEKPAEFEAGPITFEPATVMVGDSVTVTATVKNIGGIAGTYTATLAIEGQEIESKNILVDPESSKEVSFQFSKTSPGTYNIAIGSSSATMTVYEWHPYKIQYDESDGATDGIYVSGENGHIVHFTPPAKPFQIQKISIFGKVKLLDNSELDEKHITVRIWDNKGNNQLWSQDFPWRLFMGDARWQEIEVPNIRVDDDFYVELVTNSNPSSVRGDGMVTHSGDPIDVAPIAEIATSGGPSSSAGSVFLGVSSGLLSVILIGFDYPQSYISSPQNRPETRSGYSYMGKLIDPGKDRLKGIRWLIRVKGEGTAGN